MMQNYLTSIKTDFLRLLGAITGGVMFYRITSHFSELVSAFICTVVVITLSGLARSRQTHPILWWANLGAIAGAVGGTALVIADPQELLPKIAFGDRLMTIALLSIAGFISGLLIGKGSHDLKIPRPKEFIKGASALTTVAYAFIVALKFVFEGLDPARTLSSRLSTTTTILVATLAIPGWLGYRLGYLRFLNSDQSLF
jgi:hypothetical protein